MVRFNKLARANRGIVMIKGWSQTFSDSFLTRWERDRKNKMSFMKSAHVQQALTFAQLLIVNFASGHFGDSAQTRALWGDELIDKIVRNATLYEAFLNGSRADILLELMANPTDMIGVTISFQTFLPGTDRYVVILAFLPEELPQVISAGVEYGLPPSEW